MPRTISAKHSGQAYQRYAHSKEACIINVGFMVVVVPSVTAHAEPASSHTTLHPGQIANRANSKHVTQRADSATKVMPGDPAQSLNPSPSDKHMHTTTQRSTVLTPVAYEAGTKEEQRLIASLQDWASVVNMRLMARNDEGSDDCNDDEPVDIRSAEDDAPREHLRSARRQGSDALSEIATLVREARGARTRDAIGQQAGITSWFIAEIEHGTRPLNDIARIADQLAAALGLAVDDLHRLAGGGTGDGARHPPVQHPERPLSPQQQGYLFDNL